MARSVGRRWILLSGDPLWSDFASAHRLSALLAELDEALDLILVTPHLFGFCRDCGEPIEPRRLELVPWALKCSACARRGEVR